MTTTQVSVSELEANCLHLLEEVRESGQPLEIVNDGEPLTVVYPPTVKLPRAPFGVMRDTLCGPVGDLVTAVKAVKWEAIGK